MKELPENWEVVCRKTNHFWITTLLGFFLDGVVQASVTWTVRQKSTGITRRVTADSEWEAADKIANGQFDADKAVVE
jgi:hypothetical protein